LICALTGKKEREKWKENISHREQAETGLETLSRGLSEKLLRGIVCGRHAASLKDRDRRVVAYSE
jgi:hypothetical protein